MTGAVTTIRTYSKSELDAISRYSYEILRHDGVVSEKSLVRVIKAAIDGVELGDVDPMDVAYSAAKVEDAYRDMLFVFANRNN